MYALRTCYIARLASRRHVMARWQVFFCGQGADKVASTMSEAGDNFGFDDERGDYNVAVGDHIGYRYETNCLIGNGSFGQVIKAFDHKKLTSVAIKIIRNKPRFHKQVQERTVCMA